MNTLKVAIGSRCQLVLYMSDFNRLRWCVYAIQTNAELRKQVQNSQSTDILDSTRIAAMGLQPQVHSYVVLWDGLNSLLELLRLRPDLQARDDLKYLYVGTFAEVSHAMPPGSMPLFPRKDTMVPARVSLPFSFNAAVRAKTYGRRFKNLLADPSRHDRLSKGGFVVFCGLVRPTTAVVSNILTNKKLKPLTDEALKLGNMHLFEKPAPICTQARILFQMCSDLGADTAEEYCGIYSLLNICSRMVVISLLKSHGCNVFISEYGFQSNFDAYDTHAYHDNLFLDFGSSRGACHWYPRTMDMRATGKKFISMRTIREDQSLGEYLADHTDTDFLASLDSDVQHILRALA